MTNYKYQITNDKSLPLILHPSSFILFENGPINTIKRIRKEMKKMMLRILLSLLAVIIFAPCLIQAQVVRNPKLSSSDLDAAKNQMRQVGGSTAELIYSVRVDAVDRGNFDCLVVVYAKAVKGGKDYYAMVYRDKKIYPLAFDQDGRALKSGDRFLRIGLKHETGRSPILRLMGAAVDPTQGEQQRNLDFRYTGDEFGLESQSVASIAK
jgi:hypothetical protein